MGIIERETTGLERVEAVEGEIREFVQRDIASRRRPSEDDGDQILADEIGSLIERVSASSVHEIDRLMSYLGTLREWLQDEGERVQREIVEYATLSQAAMQSTKIIAESLIHLKRSDAPQRDVILAALARGDRAELRGFGETANKEGL